MVHPTSVLNLVALFPFQILLPQATLNDTACLLGSSSVTMCLTEKRMDGHLDFHGLPLVLLAAFRAEQRCPNSVLCSLEFSCISIPTAISAMRSNEQIGNEWSQHNTTTRLIIVILQSLCLSCWDSPETRLLGLRATLDPIINCCDLSTHTHKKKCGNGWTWWESWGIVNWIYLNQMLQQQSQKLRLLLAKLMSPTWSSSHSLGSMVHMANPYWVACFIASLTPGKHRLWRYVPCFSKHHQRQWICFL